MQPNSAQRKQHYELNKEQISKRRKELRLLNLDHYKAMEKQRWDKNKDGINRKRRGPDGYPAKYRKQNQDKIRQDSKTRYDSKKEEISLKSKEYREKNHETILQKKRAYREQNKDKINQQRNIKRKTDILYQFEENIRHNVRHQFQRSGLKKVSRTKHILGCSSDEFRTHIIKQFKNGMTLENHGSVWHLDHILPISYAKSLFVDIEKQKEMVEKLCHYTNYQPLYQSENLSKNKYWLTITTNMVQ